MGMTPARERYHEPDAGYVIAATKGFFSIIPGPSS
jgi:hypothetical protein